MIGESINNRISKPKNKLNYLLYGSSIILLSLIIIVLLLSVKRTYQHNLENAEAIASSMSLFIPEKLFTQTKTVDTSEKIYNDIILGLSTYVSAEEDIAAVKIVYIKDYILQLLISTDPSDTSVDNVLYKTVYEQNMVNSSSLKLNELKNGKWLVAIPISDTDTNEVIGILSAEFYTQKWYEDFIKEVIWGLSISSIILIIWFGIINTSQKNIKLRLEKSQLLESENKLKESETMFRTIFNQAQIGISINTVNKNIVTDTGSVFTVNKAYEKITGYTKEQLRNIHWKDLTYKEDLSKEIQLMDDYLSNKIKGYVLEKRIILADGTISWTNIIISDLHITNGEDRKYICILKDISKRKLMEQSLQESERSKSILLNNIPGMAFRAKLDNNRTMEFISEGCYDLTGYKSDYFLNKKDMSYYSIIDNKYLETVKRNWQKSILYKTRCSLEYEIRTASGKKKWVFEQGQAVYNDNGEAEIIEGLVIDINARKEHELRLRYINDHNQLTGINNKKYFQDLIDKEIEEGISGSKAVLLLNLRNFSLLNVIYGYTHAESIIKELANDLQLLCENRCQIFHISVDRFILYCKGYSDKNELEQIAVNIITMLDNKFITKTMGGSIGVYILSLFESDVDLIIKKASIAADNADRNNVFSFMFFDDVMEKQIIREAMINNELANAIYENDQNKLHTVFQPIVDINTNKIIEFETLARFNSDKLGLVPPNEFIPIAEEKQMIVPMSKIIMEQAFTFLKKLLDNNLDIIISINLSAIQLLREEFIGGLADLVQRYDVPPSKICLEITETVIVENFSDINDKLFDLQQKGYSIAIDDFGTEYSSLSRESELHVNYIKIDKYFADKLLSIDMHQAITSDIISMAHKLGHVVVAEGIEYECQKEYLIDNNCDLMQGYLFSKPIKESDALILAIDNK